MQNDSGQFMHIKSLNHQQITKLKEQPHFNYVNIFGHEVLKTGVSAASRKFTRILEQAATATIFFSQCDGYVSRQIEDYVSRELKIKQAVNWETKLKTLKSHIEPDAAKLKLEEIFKNIVDVLPEDLQPYLLPTAEFHYNIEKYQLNLPSNVTSIKFINDLHTGDLVSGQVAGILGQAILLTNNNELFALNVKALQGFVVEIKEEQINQQLQTPPKSIPFESNLTMSLF
jgi:hypothetical protein